MRILVAGIGNIFHGDDAFGVETATRLLAQPMPPGVEVREFGIRSYDLAFTIERGWDAVVLVDAMPRGEAPGTLFLLEPDAGVPAAAALALVDAHSMNPMRVLEMVRALGERQPRFFVVGCEPAVLEAEDFGLSAPVAAAVVPALAMIHKLIEDLRSDFLVRTDTPSTAASSII